MEIKNQSTESDTNKPFCIILSCLSLKSCQKCSFFSAPCPRLRASLSLCPTTGIVLGQNLQNLENLQGLEKGISKVLPDEWLLTSLYA
jgi:hypothetical protein